MTKKEFTKEFKKFFGGNKTKNIIGYERDIIRFFNELDLNFDILDLSEENDYWYELRTGIKIDDRYFSIIFNHDFHFLLDEYTIDDLWNLVKVLEKEAEGVKKLFNN